MTTYIILAVLKVLDNIILTAKSILTYMNKRFLSSILVCVSQILFYTVIKQVMADDSLLTIGVVSITSGLGNFLAFPIIDKFTKDDKWQFHITGKSKEDIMKLCEFLYSEDIKYFANDGYDRQGNKTINVIVFSKTKRESTLIENYIKGLSSKCLIEIVK